MTAGPKLALEPFTSPVWTPTDATFDAEELQVAWLVTLSVVPLDKVAVAVYCRLVPAARFVVAGVMAMDTTGGGITVAVVLPLTLPFVAVIVTALEVVPTPVANPVGMIVILVVSLDAQVTLVVISDCELSLKVPVAVNGCCVWYTMDGLTGVTAIDTSVDEVTVKVAAGLTTEPKVAVIMAEPVVTPVATPCDP